MDWTFSSTKKLERLLKSLEKKQKALLASYHEQVGIIVKNPKDGSILHGALSSYFSWDWTFSGVSLRICYKVVETDKHIYLVYFGFRENFYRDLIKYIFK